MTLFNDRLKKHLGLFAMLALFAATGCGQDSGDSSNPGNPFPHASPKLSSTLEGYDNFSSAAAAKLSLQGDALNKILNGVTNYGHAAGNALLWNTILGISLFPHALNFAVALNQTPVLQQDGLWLWTYNLGTFTSKLTANISGSTITWEVRVSNSDPLDPARDPFTDRLWYSGTSNLTGSSGQWILRNDYPFDKDVLQIDWVHNPLTGIGNVKYEIIDDLHASFNGYIAYGNHSTSSAAHDSYYKIYDPNLLMATPIEIEWNSTSIEGRIKDERPLGGLLTTGFGDTDWHYWDGDGLDTDTAIITGASNNEVVMNGRWSAGCEADGSDSEKNVLLVNYTTFTMTMDRWFGNTSCSGSSDLTAALDGTFSIGGPVDVTLDGSTVTANMNDVSFASATYTPNNAGTAAMLISGNFCETVDWTVGVTKDVSLSSCMPASPKKDIIYIDDTVEPNLMYSGISEEDGGTLDGNGYPTALELPGDARL